MKIEILQGTSKRLYSLVAPLVMNPSVIRQNDGIAFKTSEKHTWIIATSNGKCIGFLPMKVKDGCVEVNNYYATKRNPEIMEYMIKAAVQHLGVDVKLMIITQKSDYEVLTQLGFSMMKKFVKCAIYTK